MKQGPSIAANSILNVLNKPDECIQMFLLYANCVPCLTYDSAVKDFPSRQMTDCNTALNDAIRKIFSYNRWESVRFLRTQLGYKSVYEIFECSKNKFLNSLSSHHNATLSRLYTMIQVEL